MKRNSPGFAEWFLVTALILGVIFLLYQLYQYGSVRDGYPNGLTIAGIDMSGKTEAEATQLLTERYIDAPITIYHQNSPFQLSPAQAEFSLDYELMLTRAESVRVNQNYWSGFWGYLTGRPVDIDPILISATHNEDTLRDALRIILGGGNLDQFATAPTIDDDSLGFTTGAPGLETDLEASLDDVTAALYRPINRSAELLLVGVEAPERTVALLTSSLINLSQEFEVATGGVASVYVMSLETGEEASYNPRVPMTSLGVINVAGMLELARQERLGVEHTDLLEQAATENDVDVFNLLLEELKRPNEETTFNAAIRLTNMLQTLGLVNSYVGCPVDAGTPCQEYATMANSEPNSRIEPSPYFQTTAEDTTLLLSMIYDCTFDGGTLRVLYDSITAGECFTIIEAMKKNKTVSQIEQGIPRFVQLAHRHAWLSDTYSDAGIVYSPAGDYIIVEYTHKPDFLDWEDSSTLMADLSRSTYNYFNFDDQFLDE